MLPSLKVKSLQQGSSMGGERGSRFGQPTRRVHAPLAHAVRVALVLLALSERGMTQPVVPSAPKLGSDGVRSSVTSADVSSDVRLEVHQAESTQDCPDASRIRDALLAQHVNVSPGRLRVVVEFQRRRAVLIASIAATGARVGSRELELETGDCQALLQPLVVFLSLLLDPDAASAAAPGSPAAPARETAAAPGSPAAPARETAAAPGSPAASKEPAANAERDSGESKPRVIRAVEPSRPVRKPKAHARAGDRTSSAPATFPRAPDQTNHTARDVTASKPMPASRASRGAFAFGLDLGPLLMVGLIPRMAYGLELQGFARYQFLSLRIAAAGFAAETITQAGGRVRAQSYYGRLGLCGQWPWRGVFAVSVCQGSWLGRFVVQGEGLATDRTASPWFVALGGFFDAGWRVHDGFGVYLRGGGFAPLTRHYFSIDGVAPSAFRSQSFGAWIGLGTSWTFQ